MQFSAVFLSFFEFHKEKKDSNCPYLSRFGQKEILFVCEQDKNKKIFQFLR